MKRYEKYKDSGIQWFGEIPEHWEVKRLGSYFIENKNINKKLEHTEAYQFNYGTLQRKSREYNQEEDASVYSKYIILEPNDVVINGLNLNYDFVSQRVAISNNYGIITSAYICMRPREKTNARYFCYLLKSMDAKKHFHGMGTGIRLTLSFNELKKQYLAIPPLTEQQRIVDFLKEKTFKINQYISQREREKELLECLKQSEIANVVTKGLNPSAPMKDSGIPWIGMIPEHWEIRTISQVSKVHFISNKIAHNQNLLSLSYGKIVNKDINTTDGLLPASYETYQLIENGNIILRLTDLQNDQKSLRVGLSTQTGIITSAYLALETFVGTCPNYLYYLLHSLDVKKVFYGMGNGLRQNLNWSELKKLNCISPPLSEQQAIADYLENRINKINSYIADLQAEIDYLKEFKQRLISDTVTGKINVQPQV